MMATTLGIGTGYAGITIHGNPSAYQETGGDWQSMGTNDIDGSGGLGTDGYIFFGVFDGFNTSGPNGGAHDYLTGTPAGSVSLPGYISSHAAGADFGAIADEFAGYGSIDNPNFMDGTDTLGGFALAGGAGGEGTNRELVTFTVSGLPAGDTVRVGILAGIEANGDGRWDSTSITLSDGITSATVGDHINSPLPANPGGTNTGWVFFDIDADGTYGVSGTKRGGVGNGNQGPGVSGITFDSISGAFDPDTDNDGLLDYWEMNHAGNLTDLDGTGDFDGDGLTDLEEFDLAITTSTFPGLDPTLADTDSDGYFDGAESNSGTFVSYDYGTNTGDTGSHPLMEDTDSDGLLDGVESGGGFFTDATDTGSDPNVADSDLDGLDDNFETVNSGAGYDPNIDQATSDFDGDSSTVAEEIAAGTNVLLPDTDGDGFYDGAESNSGTFVSYDYGTNTGDTGTNPLVDDTDGDGLLDGVESNSGSLTDLNDTGTDPLNDDTDSDGFNDGDEVAYGGNPHVSDDSLPNATYGYHATGGDWLTAFADFDIGSDGALGTDGYIFFGNFTGSPINGQPYEHHVESSLLPIYLSSHGPGADFSAAASGFVHYGLIDEPTLLDGSDQLSGFALSTEGGAGSVLEVMTFEINGLGAGQVVRVGILAGVEGTEDGRWDPTRVVLAGPGGYLKAALDLEANPGGVNAGWLFFDISTEGVYTISAGRSMDTGGAGIAGLTFDTFGGSSGIPFSVANNSNGEDLDFKWTSRNGVVYNLLSSTTLDTDPATWTPVFTGLTPSVPDATLSIERPAESKRFYVIQEVPAP